MHELLEHHPRPVVRQTGPRALIPRRGLPEFLGDGIDREAIGRRGLVVGVPRVRRWYWQVPVHRRRLRGKEKGTQDHKGAPAVGRVQDGGGQVRVREAPGVHVLDFSVYVGGDLADVGDAPEDGAPSIGVRNPALGCGRIDGSAGGDVVEESDEERFAGGVFEEGGVCWARRGGRLQVCEYGLEVRVEVVEEAVHESDFLAVVV